MKLSIDKLFIVNHQCPDSRRRIRHPYSDHKASGLTLYQPKLICRKTHGIVAHDHYWIRYADDPSDLSHASLMQEMSKAVKTVSGDTSSQRHIG